MKNTLGMIVLAAASVVATACTFEHSSTVLAPSDSSSELRSLVGTWRSAASLDAFSDPNSCTSVQWHVTTQTATSVAGEFSATCPGGVTLTGTATGRLEGSEVVMQASGTASAAGSPSCSFSLSGRGTLAGDTLTLPYSGTTCLGPIQGTAVLRR